MIATMLRPASTDRIGPLGEIDARSWSVILLAASAVVLISERREPNPTLIWIIPFAICSAGLLRERRPRVADAIVVAGLIVGVAHETLSANARLLAMFSSHPVLFRIARATPTGLGIAALLICGAILVSRRFGHHEPEEPKQARYRPAGTVRPQRPHTGRTVPPAAQRSGR